MNELLREHVTSTAFSLTLSKRQIDLLVALHHFKGDYHQLIQWEYQGNSIGNDVYQFRRKLFSHTVPTGWSLMRRGLINKEDKSWKLTKAGHIVTALLKEAGIYQDRLQDMGMVAA